MNRTEKAELGKSLKEKFEKATVAVFADYKGITATQADELRKQLRAHKVEVKVLKNNIAQQAAKDGSLGAQAKFLMDELVGPTLVAFSFGDPSQSAKIMHQFATDHEAFKLKDSLFGQKLLKAAEVEELAKLPSREILLAKMLGSLNSPMQNFVGVLAAVPRSLLNVLSALEQSKSGKVD